MNEATETEADNANTSWFTKDWIWVGTSSFQTESKEENA